MLAADALEDSFAAHRDHVWGLGYRMLGTAADADELLQDTFVRLLESPPADLEVSLRPWLVRVASNLACDRLRQRKVRGYVGTWLPGPIDSARMEALLPDPQPNPEQAALARESLTLAFLRALEVLSPTQRAVVVLRDALSYSTREAAAALELSESNVKTTLHRARQALAEGPQRIDRPVVSAAALSSLAECLVLGDTAGLLRLLAPDVKALSDSAGEFVSARLEVLGAEKVSRFLSGLVRQNQGDAVSVSLSLNGHPALVSVRIAPKEGYAPRTVVRVELNAEGRIQEVWLVGATRKLDALPPAAAPVGLHAS